MREIRQWQAYDGTIFDDEEKCREYETEKKIASIENEVIFYNYQNKVIDAPFNTINPSVIYGMVIKSKKAMEIVKDYFEQYDSITPIDFETEEDGCWVWSDEKSDWLMVEKVKEEIEEKLEDYNRMLEELKNVKKIMNRG